MENPRPSYNGVRRVYHGDGESFHVGNNELDTVGFTLQQKNHHSITVSLQLPAYPPPMATITTDCYILSAYKTPWLLGAELVLIQLPIAPETLLGGLSVVAFTWLLDLRSRYRAIYIPVGGSSFVSSTRTLLSSSLSYQIGVHSSWLFVLLE